MGEEHRKIQIAIIVPVYNAGNKLRKCIQSILSQSFQNFNLILVNDGSTDKSGKICDFFSKKDQRICAIHQENKGSVEARKTGIFSEKAQAAEYLMLCDADDCLPKEALNILMTMAKKYQADCVCGKMRQSYKGFPIPNSFIKFTPPCFRSNEVQVYNHTKIMQELYVSCFGISNYPINLFAKLYRKDLLMDAANFDPIVHFMGEDLSVTLRVMPNIDRLVIIPNTVYYYNIGGWTSKFMPYMLDDFLALYHYKDQLRLQYGMDSSVKTLMEIELLNIAGSYLQMCRYQGKFSESEMYQEISKVISIPEIEMAAISLNRKKKEHMWIPWILNKDVEAIKNIVDNWYKRSRLKRIIKHLLKV